MMTLPGPRKVTFLFESHLSQDNHVCMADYNFECSAMLQMCVNSTLSCILTSPLKKGLVENSYEQVCLALQGTDKRKINRLMKFEGPAVESLHLPPLCIAICHRNLRIVNCLLENGANPNRFGHMQIMVKGRSKLATRSLQIIPLHLALDDFIKRGVPFDSALASALIASGADVNTREGPVREAEEEGGSIAYRSRNTPLHSCLSFRHPCSRAAFLFLLDNGADALKTDIHGRTPLNVALDSLFETPDFESDNIGWCADELIRRECFPSLCQRRQNRTPNIRSEFEHVLLSLKFGCGNSRQKELRRAHFLLDVGYKCLSSEIPAMKKLFKVTPDQTLLDKACNRHMYGLQHLCRRTIRDTVRRVHSSVPPQKLSQLPLPEPLISYLNFTIPDSTEP